MADVLVRNVEESVLLKIKQRAKRNGRSLQSELTQVFRSLAEVNVLSDDETALKIKESLRGRKFVDSAEELREDRER